MSQQINLFNEALLGRGKAATVVGMLQGAIAVLGILLAFYGYMYYQYLEQKQLLEKAGKNLLTEQARLDELTRQRKGVTVEQELKAAEAEALAQSEIINALKNGVIGNTRGYSGYMQAFARQSITGLWLTGFAIDGDASQMTIKGAALSSELVPLYIQRLSHERIMRGKEFASLQMQLAKIDAAKPDAAQYLEFVLQSVVTGEVDKK